MDELGIELDRARWRTNVKNRGDDLIRYIRESLYNNNNSNNNGKKKGSRGDYFWVCVWIDQKEIMRIRVKRQRRNAAG